MLEGQVKEARQMVEESDIKYDEVARKLAMVEGGKYQMHAISQYLLGML